jgi:hypothetical protein
VEPGTGALDPKSLGHPAPVGAFADSGGRCRKNGRRRVARPNALLGRDGLTTLALQVASILK